MKLKRIPFTKQGYVDLLNEQKNLLEKRKDAVINLATARAMGDLSENAAYKVARSKLSSIDARLRRLNQVIKSAYIVEKPITDKVEVGCSVTVIKDTIKQTFQIVNGYESDPAKGKLSYYSPVGKMLMGKRKGDVINVITPTGTVRYIVNTVK